MLKNFFVRNQNFFFGMAVGMAILLIIYGSLTNSDVFGNVADWVSGIGSIGAILIVFWQVKKQSTENQQNYERDQEFKYKVSRPLLKMSIENLTINGCETIYNDFADLLIISDEYWLIKLENLSNKPLLAVDICHVGNNNSPRKFFIPNIGECSTTYLMIGKKLESGRDQTNELLSLIETGTISFVTELGEQCFAKFEKYDADKIKIFDWKYENQCRECFDQETDISGKETSFKQKYTVD